MKDTTHQYRQSMSGVSGNHGCSGILLGKAHEATFPTGVRA
jgi:hypothetical protein